MEGGPYFFVNATWWEQHRELVISSAMQFGYNAIVVPSPSNDDTDIVWKRGE